ncbi:unnamed protein product [Pararhodospirillum photometricum DSM 122]|uniref:Uncharacterized protein n=1 Tax=Pararhodospirillum photometricum DSM 122 TaxID=1150469 RepID=H6SQU6_PARPM|nr:unnamed protein product [Pararhodospirillum photometricum DSM 122]
MRTLYGKKSHYCRIDSLFPPFVRDCLGVDPKSIMAALLDENIDDIDHPLRKRQR